jgi:hypothetical protein
MSRATSEALANVAIASLGAMAAYYIATRPHLRRMAWRALKYAVLTGVPQYLWDETRRAWEASDPRRDTRFRSSSFGGVIMPM